MRYAQIRKMDISNGLGVGVALFTQGCPFRCKNCFNPETWDFDGGKEYTQETFDTIIELLKRPYISRFSILGGEPLIDRNLYQLACLVYYIKKNFPHIKIWVYSGYTYEQLQERAKDSIYLQSILDNIDVLVDGQFVQEQKDITYKFAGSTNQRVINMRRTQEENSIVLLDI